MVQNPSVSETRAFHYIVLGGEGHAMNHPVGRLYIREVKAGANRAALSEIAPDYGFQVITEDGNLVAEIAPGMWPFVRKVIEEGATFHSNACLEDCNTPMGDITVVSGETK